MIRRFLALTAFIVLTACAVADPDSLDPDPKPIGDFQLGFNFAGAPEPEVGPFSREATGEEWKAAVETAVKDRLGRYSGGHFYHIAVSVRGYVLAQPGIPVVYNPKSVLIFDVTFFDDQTQSKINEEPIQLTVFEPCCAVPLLGSGMTRTKEEQLANLAFSAARAIERTMRENANWFGGVPEVLGEDPTILTNADITEILEENAAEAEN